MNSTNVSNPEPHQATQPRTHHRSRTSVLRWTGLIGLLSGIAIMGALVTTAAPANAMVRFCNATVCIGQPNGCNIRASNGTVIMVDDGDSIIAVDGSKWTCTHGQWTVTAKMVSTTGTTPVPTVSAVTAQRATLRLAN